MPGFKLSRLSEDMLRETALILRQIKDPRIPSMTSVTGIEVTKDLKNAKIYFSALEGDPKEIKKGLMSAAGFIRRELASRLNLRNTPELAFIHDDSLAYGAHIESLLQKISEDGKKHEESAEKPGDEE